MFGPREMLLSSEEPVVRQFLNAQRIGPIGMSEEKDAVELAAESGQDLPPLPPIPLQLPPSDGLVRRTARPPGEWCRANGVTPPPGSFLSAMAVAPQPVQEPYGAALAVVGPSGPSRGEVS
jgi:phospholipid/cholesterol/gamma-HCH transport system ATP-binding protein